MVAVVVFVLSPGTGHQRCDMVLRMFVSRNAAGKGRAILEGVGLPGEIRDMCYTNNASNEEEAVQAGLMKWKDGRGSSATWMVLLEAMKYAEISVQHITRLKEELLTGAVFSYLKCCSVRSTHVLCPSCYNPGHLLCSNTCTAATTVHTVSTPQCMSPCWLVQSMLWLVIRRTDKVLFTDLCDMPLKAANVDLSYACIYKFHKHFHT